MRVIEELKLRTEKVLKKDLDRHLLYPGFQSSFEENDVEKDAEARLPILESCIRMPGRDNPWDLVSEFHPLLGHDNS